METIAFDLKDYAGAEEARSLQVCPELFGEDDDLAACLGGLCLGLAGRRLSRVSFLLRGWPLRLVGVLGDAGLRAQVVEEFQLDHRAYMALKSQPPPPPVGAQLHPAQLLFGRCLLAVRGGWCVSGHCLRSTTCNKGPFLDIPARC